jgi:subtilase family serine protease
MSRFLRHLFLALAVLPFLAIGAQAQRVINDADRITRRGNTNPLARAEFDRGSADINTPMKNMILSLSLRPGAQAELQTLLAQQQDPSSPNYHKFLTPEEFGLRFGPTDQDLADVTNWLAAQGFKVEEVGKGRLWINFSGNVQQVERAFQTNIRKYEVNGKMHQANAIDPSLPRAFSGLVNGVVTLHNFGRHHFLSKITPIPAGLLSTRSQLPSDFKALRPGAPDANNTVPDFTSGTNHFLAPADFATIYNVNPLYSAGITGAGQSIAIVGRTDIKLADVQFFRSFFGLPAKDPVFIHNGTAPGDLGGGEETEADLDVEWSGAVGQGATINFVISKSTATTDGVDLSAQFIVNNNTSPIMSTSFGQCEANMGTAENNFYNNLWSQAAAEGITAFVSSGDSGAAGCDASNAATGTGRAVSGLSSPPNVTAVGGTMFNEGTGTFWNATNNATNQGSAISYIPEVVWNESGSNGGSGLGATGGGASTIYAKPAFQSGPGVPADGHRDVPDVSLSAAGHDGFIVVQGHTTGTTGLEAVGGTSASSPSFAGLMSLVVQKTGARQGNANTAFYNMGRNQQSGGTAVYHDITTGNNTVPGVTGFAATVGYDLSTGWGSVNAANLVNFWNNNGAGPADFSVSASPASLTITQGTSGNSTISITAINGFTGSVSLSASGLPAGVTASFGTNPATSTSVLTLTASSTATTGTATVTVTGTSGTLTHTTTINLTVNAAAAPNFSLSASPASLTVTQGTSGNRTITVTPSGGFTGSVTLSASGLPAGVTAAFGTNPATSTSVLTFTASSTATTGTATVTITGTSGTLTHTTTISLTIASSAAQNLIVNGGFEAATATPWTLTAGVLNTSAAEPPHSGAKNAWLDGYGVSHTDTATQTVTIPSTITTANLTFWLHIDTAETTTVTAFDTLRVQVLNSAGTTVLATLGTFSNLNHAAGYQQHSFSVAQFKGQTVRIRFIGTEDTSLQTSFVLDDVSLNVQ